MNLTPINGGVMHTANPLFKRDAQRRPLIQTLMSALGRQQPLITIVEVNWDDPMKILIWLTLVVSGWLNFFLSNVFADADIPAICSASNPKIREQMNKVVDEYYKAKATKTGFRCGGLEVIDYASALDGELYYVDASTRELISICGMGLYISVSSKNIPKCGEICPPMKWRENNCDEQYTKFLKAKFTN